MRVLMISIDKGLLGKGQLGDVIQRHKKYGEFVDKLDIVVFSKQGFEKYKISDKVTAYPTNSKSKLKYYFDSLKLGKKLFKQDKYDLIVTQEPFITGLVGYKLKKKFGSKLLIHFHGDFWANPNWLKESKLNWLFLKISKFVVPRADAIRVMSQGQKEKLKKFGDKVKVISTPVDLDKYLKHETYNMKQEGKKTVMHVGRYDEVKDFITLDKAWEKVNKKNPEVDFYQIGGGDKVVNIIKSVNFTAQPNTDQKTLIEKWYPIADVVVSSSTSESFGKVLVEANACGKPVVSTATTGAKEIIKDGYNGYLVPIGDAQALADKILYLLNNPDEAKKMGENGRELVKEKYGDNTEKIINYWQEIVNA